MNPFQLLTAVVCFAALVIALVAAQSASAGDGYDLTWHTIDGGGGTSVGGGFALSGTIGQHDAGVMSGGGYTLAGGFWAVDASPEPPTNCPADLTGNNSVGVPDLLELLSQWGPCADPQNCPADLTGNGTVGVPDLLELLSQWGPCPQ